MQAFGVPADHFEIDLTIARGLDYYTGTVYETAMLDHPEIGSICSGGRYDNLLARFGKDFAATGFAVVIDQLMKMCIRDRDVDDLVTPKAKGWQLVCVDGFALGWGKLSGGTLKNKYCTGWRWM